MEYIVFHTTMNHPSSQIMEKTRKTPKQKKKKFISEMRSLLITNYINSNNNKPQ